MNTWVVSTVCSLVLAILYLGFYEHDWTSAAVTLLVAVLIACGVLLATRMRSKQNRL